MKELSIFNVQINPLSLAAVVGLIQLLAIWIMPLVSDSPTICWEVAFTFLLLFSLVNSILSLNSVDQNKYWFQSIIAFVLFAIAGGLVSWKVSGISIYDLDSLKIMYVIFTFMYLILLTIIRTMRKIIELAQKHDSRMNN